MSLTEERKQSMDLFAQKKLQDAIDIVEAGIDEGVICPCCGQYCKRYKRKLNSSMAAGLVWLVHKAGGARNWINVQREAPRRLVQSFQLGTLKHWGLVEQKKNERTEKRTSGIWRPTELGRRFVINRWQVMPTHVFIRNGDREGYADETCTIEEALGEDFDYAELMRGGGFESKKEQKNG